jgi:uncharacterized membrane protein YsdA (DUF1294 family)
MPEFAQALLLPFCVVLFFAVMALRIKFLPRDTRKRTPEERLKLVRILIAAVLAWMAVYYQLQRTSHSIDGKGPYEPGMLERIVMALSD